MSSPISQIIDTYNQKTVSNINSSSNAISVISVNKLNTLNTKTLKLSVTDVRSRAARLSERLNNPSRFLFYCKVVWHLPESVIENNLEQALAGRNPQNYFSWLCKRDLCR